MSEVTKQIKSWAKKHKWLTDLAADIDRIEGLLSAESDAEIRLAGLVEQIGNKEAQCAELNAQADDIKQAAADAKEASDKHIIANKAACGQALESADDEATIIVARANDQAEQIIADAERVCNDEMEKAAAAQDAVVKAQAQLDEINAEQESVSKSIAGVKARMAEALNQVIS